MLHVVDPSSTVLAVAEVCICRSPPIVRQRRISPCTFQPLSLIAAVLALHRSQEFKLKNLRCLTLRRMFDLCRSLGESAERFIYSTQCIRSSKESVDLYKSGACAGCPSLQRNNPFPCDPRCDSFRLQVSVESCTWSLTGVRGNKLDLHRMKAHPLFIFRQPQTTHSTTGVTPRTGLVFNSD